MITRVQYPFSFEAPPSFYGNLRMAFAHPMKTELKFTLITRLLHVSTHSSFYRPACIKDHLLAAGLTMGQNPGQITSRRNLDETRPNLGVCDRTCDALMRGTAQVHRFYRVSR